ncbi:MAG: sugar phosphate isomerase/epimerase [Planctomycetes bacterium]|nr:sugar phosphate isomerase/epimerase [Planctomycetota bacterium]
MPRLSFTTMGTPALNGFEAIAAAKEYGYQGVDLRVHHVKGEIQVDDSDATIGELRKCAEDSGIGLPSLLCYNATGNKDDANSWNEMADSIRRHLEIAHCIGAEGIRIFGGPILDYSSPEAYIAEMAKVLQNVLDEDDSNLRIVLQNHGGSYTFMQGVALKKATARDRFAMCYSPDHCRMMDEKLDDVYAVAKDNSLQIYLSDVKINDDGTHGGVLPGEGNVDWVSAYNAIGGDDFPGWVSFKWEKIWQDQLAGPEVALPHFIKYFNEHLA